MNNEFFNRYNSKNTLCRFRHRFVFYVSNLYEIVSIEAVNFHAGFQQPMEKDGYFWGKYELLVSYRRGNNDSKIRQRRFTRGFFFKVPFCFSGLGDKEQGEGAGYLNNCTCDAEFSHQIAPLFLLFFPLFSRLKYVPFKAVIYVHGMITEAADEKVVDEGKGCGEDCSCKQEGESSEAVPCGPEEEMETVILEDWTQSKNDEEASFDVVNEDGCGSKYQSGDVLDLDLIALDRKKEPQKPGYESEQYGLFYDMFIEHQESIHKTEKDTGS